MNGSWWLALGSAARTPGSSVSSRSARRRPASAARALRRISRVRFAVAARPVLGPVAADGLVRARDEESDPLFGVEGVVVRDEPLEIRGEAVEHESGSGLVARRQFQERAEDVVVGLGIPITVGERRHEVADRGEVHGGLESTPPGEGLVGDPAADEFVPLAVEKVDDGWLRDRHLAPPARWQAGPSDRDSLRTHSTWLTVSEERRFPHRCRLTAREG